MDDTVTRDDHRHLAVGGQALIEGVMMRGPQRWAAAARRPDGTIATTSDAVPTWARRFDRVPVVRGSVALVETMLVGLRALRWSAQVADPDDDRSTSNASLALTTVLTLTVFTAIFAVVPAAVARLVTDGGLAFGLVEGLARLGLFLAYVVAIGRSPAIRRTFAYHGAEHKTIAAHEAGAPLEPESVDRFSTRHARCGTDFLLLVVVVAIIVFTLIGDAAWPVLVATRVVGLPIVAGLAYEVLKLAKRFPANPVVGLMVAPGLALQALTTRPPTPDQIEVAIAALDVVLQGDEPAVVH